MPPSAVQAPPVDPNAGARAVAEIDRLVGKPGAAENTHRIPMAGEVIHACKEAVRSQLAAPDEAEIDGPYLDPDQHNPTGQVIWKGTVKGKNLMGVRLSASFLCGFDPETGRARSHLIQ